MKSRSLHGRELAPARVGLHRSVSLKRLACESTGFGTVLEVLRLHASVVEAKAAAHTRPSASDSDVHTSGCPFLAALPAPSMVTIPWYQRLIQLTKPLQFQSMLLGKEKMVQTPSQIGFPALYMPGTIEMGKAVFAGEGDFVKQYTLGGFGLLIGEHSLLTLHEPHHKHLRNLLQPAFTAEAVGTQMQRIVRVMDKFLNRWADAEGPVQGAVELKRMTFDFIMQVVYGREISDAECAELTQLFKTWTGGLLGWPYLNIPFTPFANAIKAREALMARFQVEIDVARKQVAAGEVNPGVIGTLVTATDEEDTRLTDLQIAENILLLLFAGHDTSSSTLGLTMANLNGAPAVLAKLREEQQLMVAKHGPQLTPAVLKDMVYADAVIRETLRKDTIVPALSRIAAKDFELDGYAVPAGTTLTMPLKLLSVTDPRWVDGEGDMAPDVFNPERMLTPEGSKPGSQMPFGYGPRYCLGYAMAMAEMKVFLALLARGYTFNADTNTEWVQAIGPQPKNGLPMTVYRL